MTLFGAAGRDEWIRRLSGRALMRPDDFSSVHFARVAGDLNVLLCVFRAHREMPEFIRQLAAVVKSRPPDDDPPASGVLSRLPGDGSPSPGGLLHTPPSPERRMVETDVAEPETSELPDAPSVEEDVARVIPRRLDSEASLVEQPNHNLLPLPADAARARRKPWSVRLRTIAPDLYPAFQRDPDNPFAHMDADHRVQEILSFCGQLWARTCMESAAGTRKDVAAAA